MFSKSIYFVYQQNQYFKFDGIIMILFVNILDSNNLTNIFFPHNNLVLLLIIIGHIIINNYHTCIEWKSFQRLKCMVFFFCFPMIHIRYDKGKIK